MPYTNIFKYVQDLAVEEKQVFPLSIVKVEILNTQTKQNCVHSKNYKVHL